MKIYTGTGDHGQTSLFSGERVSKGHARIDAYGDVDELSSILGWLATAVPESRPDLVEALHQIQTDLFHIGAWLATEPNAKAIALLKPLAADIYRQLESDIDRLSAQLPPLTGFILPGGQPEAAIAHVARTVCRRTERRVTALLETYAEIPQTYDHLLVYLNRLSDYLFVLARYCNHVAGTADIAAKDR